MPEKNVKGISIGTKLLFGVIFIVLILGVFGIYLTKTLNTVRRSFVELDSRYAALKEFTSIERVNSIQADATKSFILTQDQNWQVIYDDASKEYDIRLQQLKNDLAEAGSPQILEEFEDISEDLRATELLILSKVRKGDIERASELFDNEYEDRQLLSVELLNNLRQEMEGSVSEIIDGNRALILYSENILIALMIVLIVVITLVTLVFSYFLSSSIQHLTGTVKAIIAGDLTKRARINSHDEIGVLAMAFNEMTDKLSASYRGLEEKVRQKTSELQKAKDGLQMDKDRLERGKAKDEAIIESMSVGVIVTDENGDIVLANGLASKILAREMESLKGLHMCTAFALKGEKGDSILRKDSPFDKVFKNGQKFQSSKFWLSPKEGMLFPISFSVTPILHHKSVTGAVINFRDISLEKEIDTAKTEFVSLASHQLRGPLTSVKWTAEMLIHEDVGPVSDKQKDALKDLLESNEHMIDLVNKLLNISRIERGVFMIEPTRNDLREIIDGTVKDFKSSINKKELQISRNYPKVLNPLEVDANLTRIVFQNLISNAIKYTPNNGSIVISLDVKEDNIVFSVKDDGIGIPEKDHQHVFQKMFRSKNVREKQIQGNGLGLYMVKSVVEKWGGKVWFESVENKGTTFFVTIPLSGMKRKEGTKSLS